MDHWFQAGIFRKILLYILVVSLVPLLLLGALTLYSTNQAGYTAIDRSRVALDAKSAEALELRAAETAQAIADFLRERETDVRTMALLPRTPEAYLAFYQAHQGKLWYLEADAPVHREVPLYREMAYVDATGQEVLKVVDGRVAGADERYDVSNPLNTRFQSETYFIQARELLPGEVFISHVTGSYVSKPEFDTGTRFAGVLRLAQPVFDQRGELEGVVVLALDSRHLEEFTAHIVPTEERLVVASDAATGNYAYLIDDEGFPIAHPLDYHQRGVDEEGQWMPYAQGPADLGTRPIRLDRLGFADENIPRINEQALQGHAGSIQYQWEGRDKFVAYAPIPYYGGSYAAPGGFGWVAIGAEVSTFHEAAALVGEALQRTVRALATGALVIVALTGAIVLIAAGILARQISRPVQQLTGAVRAVGQGDLESARAISGAIQTRDELGILADGFANMVGSLKRRDVELQTIHQISQDIAANLDLDRTLQTVLEQVCKMIPHQRGEIYLYDETRGVLCVRARSTPAWTQADGQERVVPLGEGNTGWIAEHRQSLHIPGEKGFLGVPLVASQRLVGALVLHGGNLDEHNRRLLETIAPSAAIAVENACQVIERERYLRERIQQLQIEIDEVKRARQVAAITETDYFRQLQARARELRARAQRYGGGTMGQSTMAELFELAIAAERTTERLYRELATRFARERDVAGFWKAYAEEEAGHARWLERLRDETGPARMSAPADAEMLRAAREMSEFSVEEALGGIQNLEDAYQLANELEHSETNVIFEFLIASFAADEEIVSFLRSQLRDHVAALTIRFPTQLKSPVIRKAIEPLERE